MRDFKEQLKQALLSLERVKVDEIFTAAGEEFIPHQVIEEVVVPVLDEIGSDWENGDVALSQVYMSGRICEEMIDKILPVADTVSKPHPAMAIAILEDYHRLGKRIVYSLLKASGYEVKDYGTMNVDQLVRQVQDDDIKVLLISTLMLSSALRVKDLIGELKKNDLEVKTIVGGAPFRFDDQLWKEINADAMGKNASDAVAFVSQLFKGEAR